MPQKYTYYLHSEGKRPEDCAEIHLYKFTAPIVVRDESEHNCIKVYDNMHEYINDPVRSSCLHEVIRGNRKIFFDIDATQIDLDAANVTRENLQAEVIFYLKWNFKAAFNIDLHDDLVIICDSSDEHKFSQHIIIDGYYVMNNNEAAKFAAEVKMVMEKSYRQFVDEAVYKPLQFLRLSNMQKLGSQRVKRIITNHKEEDTLISQCKGCTALPMRCKQKSKNNKPKQYIADREEVKKILDMITLPNNVINKVLSDSHMIRSVEGNMILFKRIKPSYCQICDRTHDSDNSHYVTWNSEEAIIHCRRSSAWVPPGKSQVIRIPFKEHSRPQKVIIPDSFKVEKYNEKEVRPYDFTEHNTIIVRANMGVGKTYNLIKLFSTLDPDYSIIFVSIRRSLTSDIMSKFALADPVSKLGFVQYNNVEGKLTQKRLIVQYESLHRVDLANRDKMLLILDESESIISQMEHTSKETASACYAKFEWLCKKATNMICMDAFASLRTYTLCNKLRSNVLLSINKYCKPEARGTDYYYDEKSFHSVFLRACESATTRPIIVAATSRKQAEILAKSAQIRNPTLKIALYTANSENKHELQDINTSWLQYNIVIYTPTVTAGVSFEQAHFDKMFCYFNAKSCDVNTSIQMMGRARKIASNEFHICIINSKNEQYPNTVGEIEQSMQLLMQNSFAIQNASIVKGIKLVDGVIPLGIRDDGQGYEYKVKDTYYWLKVLNTHHRCQSIMNFASLFKQFRKKMGMVNVWKESDHNIVDTVLMTAVKYQNKEIELATIAGAKMDVFVDAHVVNFEMTPDERATAAKVALMNAYDVTDESIITPAFVKKFDKPMPKSAYKNLKLINMMNANDCNAAMNSIVNAAARTETGESFYDMDQDPTPLKLSIGMNLLNNLCAKKNDDFGLFSGKALSGRFEISKKDIDERFVAFQRAVKGLPTAFIKQHFAADVSIDYTALNADVKTKLINKIIYPTFGMKIRTKKTKFGKNTEMILEITDFKYDGTRFVPAK